jgi:hypothetical protein
MPTVRIEYNPFSSNGDIEEAVNELYPYLPAIIAPLMNIDGRDLHDGGVSESEIIINLIECSKRDVNINDIQITVIAHNFEERVARVDEITNAIRDGVKTTLHAEIFDGDYINIKVGISIWLVEMGYATINKES